MSDIFPIIEIPFDGSQDIEDLGTKEKYWFQNKSLLFKKARPNTGEDWSEKIAAELCVLLELPHADYELAIFNGEHGIISTSFLPKDGIIELGNEILDSIIPNYPEDSKDLSQHTIYNISQAINNSSINLPIGWNPPDGISQAIETFIGYLLLDAWIGNTDRHHENWGVIKLESKIYLAPTYDHASSMGRELSDDKRLLKLKNQSVINYGEKCSSLIYASIGNRKRLKTFEVFCEAQEHYPSASRIWLSNLEKVSKNDTLEIFKRIPSHRISEAATEFAQKILEFNQSRLLKLGDIIL